LSQLNSDKERMASMSNVLRLTPPVIIVTDQFKYSEILLKVASKYKTAILHSSLPSAQLYVTVAA
jgi:serine kinase of HPr protein (carbohydrate metabolism regulator)